MRTLLKTNSLDRVQGVSKTLFSPDKSLVMMSPKVSSATSSPSTTPHKKRALQIEKEYLDREKEKERKTAEERAAEQEAQDREKAEQIRKKNSVIFIPGSKQDVIFVGPEETDVSKWQKTDPVEVFVVVGEEKICWIRVKKDSMATIDNIQFYLTTHCSTVFTTPMMFLCGRKLKPEEKLVDLKDRCLILANQITDQIKKHPGKIWACQTCLDKTGQYYRGNMRRVEYMKSHSKPSCRLMYQDLLSSKKTLGKSLERPEYKTIHACPEASREKFVIEYRLSKPKKAPKRKLELEAPGRNVDKSEEDCPSSTEPRDDSTVSRPREDSPSSSSERR